MTKKKFINEKKSIELSLNKTLFEFADEVKMRIPTSCGRFGDCHECIVEVSDGYEILSEPTEQEQFLKKPFRLACQASTISTEGKKKRNVMRSIYICKNVKKNEIISRKNIRVVRPAYGLNPIYFDKIIGKRFNKNYQIGQRMSLNKAKK